MTDTPKQDRTVAGDTVLVVEDDHWTRFLMHELLEAHGYTAIEAGDAAEAYELARRHRPGVILTDIKLPGRSGLDLMRQIQEDELLHGTPVAAVTALAMPQDQVMIRSYGCVDYLAKPFSSTALIETVERCIAAKRLIAA